MAKTNIEWATKVWNPVTGCDKVSPGCKFCYAERLATTRLKHLPEYHNGFLGNVLTHMSRAEQPLHWKKPAIIFVNSMSDMFHESISDIFLLSLVGIMAECPQHIFLCLTKRPLLAYKWLQRVNIKLPKNIWIGISAENQEMLNRRLPVLMQIPCAGRFLSLEPLLDEVDLLEGTAQCVFRGVNTSGGSTGIDWVIVGGESGHQARPSRPDWYYLLRDQCNIMNVPFFFKQWGEWIDIDNGYKYLESLPQGSIYKFKTHNFGTVYKSCMVHKVGKHNAGKLLEGKLYQNYPEQFKHITNFYTNEKKIISHSD